eukprot:1939506-Prymnesium_polylepis.1
MCIRDSLGAARNRGHHVGQSVARDSRLDLAQPVGCLRPRDWQEPARDPAAQPLQHPARAAGDPQADPSAVLVPRELLPPAAVCARRHRRREGAASVAPRQPLLGPHRGGAEPAERVGDASHDICQRQPHQVRLAEEARGQPAQPGEREPVPEAAWRCPGRESSHAPAGGAHYELASKQGKQRGI